MITIPPAAAVAIECRLVTRFRRSNTSMASAEVKRLVKQLPGGLAKLRGKRSQRQLARDPQCLPTEREPLRERHDSASKLSCGPRPEGEGVSRLAIALQGKAAPQRLEPSAKRRALLQVEIPVLDLPVRAHPETQHSAQGLRRTAFPLDGGRERTGARGGFFGVLA